MAAQVTAAAFVVNTITRTGNNNYGQLLNQNDGTIVTEAVSNGLWYEILRRHFPFPRCIIAPELRANDGSRTDLGVLAPQNASDMNIRNSRYFCLEGKRGGLTDTQFRNCYAQICDYIGDCVTMQQHKWGILTSGASFMVLAYNGAGFGQVRWDATAGHIRVNNINHNLTINPQQYPILNLTNPLHAAELDLILREIFSFIP